MKRHLLALLSLTAFATAADVTIPSPDGSVSVKLYDESIEIVSSGSKQPLKHIERPTDHGDTTVLWSPDSSKVAILMGVKRGSDFMVFELKNGTLNEVKWANDLSKKLQARIPVPHGNYFEISPTAWTTDGNLKILVSGNTVDKGGSTLTVTRFPAVAVIKESKLTLLSMGHAVSKPYEP